MEQDTSEEDPFDKTFGLLKGLKVNTDALLREADEGWEDCPAIASLIPSHKKRR